MVRSPVEICFGTSPSQAAKSRPFENTSPEPIAATTALEMIGPIPGTLMRRSQPASCRAIVSISRESDALVEAPPVPGEFFDDSQHARRQNVYSRRQDDRQLGAQKADALAHGDAALQHEGTDLIDDAGAL